MPVSGPEDRRRDALAAATLLLTERGPHALSLREVAKACGGSTQLIYTLFGGKPGLVDALYAEGFDRLASTASGAWAGGLEVADPERLVLAGHGYVSFARENPAFYALMFGRAVPDFVPRAATRRAGRARTLGRVVELVQACLDAGTLIAPDAETVANVCWVSWHGVSSLLLADLLPDDPGLLDHILRSPVMAHLHRADG